VRRPSLLFSLLVVTVGAAAVQLWPELAAWWRDLVPQATGTSTHPADPVGPALAGRAKVIDGDSLEVAGERIRLFGIDAPESRQDCADARGNAYPCGRDAARALAAAIGSDRVTCTPVDHDRYGRDVARCDAGGRDLGEVMVRGGHALDLPQHSGGRYAAAEREARAARRGLWAGSFEPPAAWRRQYPR
jgi:endonuclease YncB( thermonuclease family)